MIISLNLWRGVISLSLKLRTLQSSNVATLFFGHALVMHWFHLLPSSPKNISMTRATLKSSNLSHDCDATDWRWQVSSPVKVSHPQSLRSTSLSYCVSQALPTEEKGQTWNRSPSHSATVRACPAEAKGRTDALDTEA
jgi:hypothetical protein